MPLSTLERSPPPFFHQGMSALSKLIVFGALALLLMLADNRFGAIQTVRSAIAGLLYPLQWVVLQPISWVRQSGHYFVSLETLRDSAAQAQAKLGLQAQRAQQAEQLGAENVRLRALLGLRQRLQAPALAAQVLYDAADPFAHKVIIDKGALASLQAGAPVLDEFGVLGQVTRVYPALSEVTLITDRNQITPVLNVRSGLRALVTGTGGFGANSLQLYFLDAEADLQVGDLLTTSGIDGVYPAGLQVAHIQRIERNQAIDMVQVYATPVAATTASLQVLVLQPLGQMAALPAKPGLGAAEGTKTWP